MKVTIGDKTYKIAFEHQNYKALRRHTACHIFRDEPAALIAEGLTSVHKNDTYCKETGRKLSLARALANAGFTREERKLFWAVYRYRAVPQAVAQAFTSSPRRSDENAEGGAAV